MAELPYSLTHSDRTRGNFPSLPLINLIAEDVAAEPQPSLQSRPGLTEEGTVLGSGPVRKLFKIDGVLSNTLFAVSGTSFYSGTTAVGIVSGFGPVSIDSYEDVVFVNSGDYIHKYDGSTFSTISFPDSAQALKIVVGASRIIAIRKDSGMLYWSEPLETTIDPLAFATAENSPDLLKDMLFLGDTLVLFGSETVEFWPSTSNPDLPFQPMPGRTYQKGVKFTGAATKFNNSFAWVTNDNQVCIGSPENVISDVDLQDKISQSSTALLWTFLIDGVEFLALRLDDSTYTVAANGRNWSKFESVGQDNWIPYCYEEGVFGSSVDGKLLRWTTEYSDFGGELERRFRVWVPVTDVAVPLFSLTLRCNPGNTTFSSGPFGNPTIDMRVSRDGGNGWANWRQRAMGRVGDYRHKPRWTSLGYFGFPGFLGEFRLTDPVPFRLSGVEVNETKGTI